MSSQLVLVPLTDHERAEWYGSVLCGIAFDSAHAGGCHDVDDGRDLGGFVDFGRLWRGLRSVLNFSDLVAMASHQVVIAIAKDRPFPGALR